MEIQTSTVPTTTNVITALRNEAETNDVFASVAYVWANRERARRQVTIPALRQAMAKEGATWTDAQYSKVLEFLSSLGLGELRKDSKGTVTGLYNVKVTLQSIGQAAAAKREDLKKFKAMHKNKFQKLKAPPIEWKNVKSFDEASKDISPQAKMRSYNVFLTVMIGGSPIIYPGPNIQPGELGAFLLGFNNLVHGKKGTA